jgi:hypothetical protein
LPASALAMEPAATPAFSAHSALGILRCHKRRRRKLIDYDQRPAFLHSDIAILYWQ